MPDALAVGGEESKATIESLSDYALELIFTHSGPYKDFDSIKLVSKRWNRLCVATVERMKKLFLKCSNFSW